MALHLVHPVLRPILFHRRSWMILVWYLCASASASGLLWLSIDPVAIDAASPFARNFMSAPFRAALILGFGVLATGMTVIGLLAPLRRIEEWFEARERGLNVKPLKVRAGDSFETLIRLTNELNQRAKAPVAAAPRKRARSATTKAPRTRAPKAETPS